MSIVRYCADLHLGHHNLAVSEIRKFQDEYYQDEHIIDKWNSIVKKRDVTYILGDVTMEKRSNYNQLDRLNGIKIVVLGNHDMKNHVRDLLNHVEHVAGAVKIRHDGKNILLTHVPIHPSEFEYRLDYNVHGHIHNRLILDKDMKVDHRYKCVSLEHINYTPITMEELLERKFTQK
jgi:calcineurin-like phosphoesterase family protein